MDKHYNVLHDDVGAAERARVAAAIESGARAFPADPVTIRLSSSSSPGPPPKARPEVVTRVPDGIPNDYLLEFAREAEYEANHPRRPG